MASTNRHWPSMFKVKPCNQHRRWQHDVSPIHQRNPQAPGSEERGPDPKPRWNPRPEQIRILEAIFDSGMLNPSGDEIRRICAKLQEYGQVGDANVFYWFQNRKSRSKNKQRQLQSAAAAARLHPRPPKPAAAAAAAASSSSSSDHSTGSDKSLLKPVHLRYTSSCLEFGVGDAAAVSHSHPGYSLAAAKAVPESVLWSELLGAGDDGRKLWVQLHHLYAAAAAAAGVSTATSAAAPCVNASAGCDPTIVDGPVSEIQVMDGGGGREWGSAACRRTSTVVTGEAAFEVTAGRLNVREVFGKEAVLLDQSGHPLLTDEAGFTLLPLQHGAAYYLNTTRSLQQIVAMKTSNKLIPWFS